MRTRPVLVTVSGAVGTGKTTTVAHLLASLQRANVPVTRWRFQRLPCFTIFQRAAARVPSEAPAAGRATRRGGYRQTRLTFWRATGHVVRIVAFRIFRRFRQPSGWTVFDRYFYDSFVHYELTTRLERVYLAVLARLVPTPDLALLLAASPDAIGARRPEYATEYVSRIARAYGALPWTFPELIEIRTDLGQPIAARLDELLQERLR